MNLSFGFSTRARLPIAAVLLAGTALPAWALDGDAFATKLNEAYSVSGASIAYDSADVNGDMVTLTNAKVMSPGAPAMDAGDLVFEGVEETGDGGYKVEKLDIADDLDARITRQLHRPVRHRMGQRHTGSKNQCGNVRPVKVPKVLRCKPLAGSLCDPGFVVVVTDHIRTASPQRTRRCKPGPAEPEQGNLSAVECGDRDHAPTSASRLRGRAGQARRK